MEVKTPPKSHLRKSAPFMLLSKDTNKLLMATFRRLLFHKVTKPTLGMEAFHISSDFDLLWAPCPKRLDV
jgi:hypothetical protein